MIFSVSKVGFLRKGGIAVDLRGFSVCFYRD